MQKGTVKFYKSDKGYGFITDAAGNDIFVHKTALSRGTRIKTGDRVSFDVKEGEKGPSAVDVTLIGG